MNLYRSPYVYEKTSPLGDFNHRHFQPVLSPIGISAPSTIPDATKCTVSASASSIVAGLITLTVTVHAKNSSDAAITVGGASVTITNSGGTSTGIFSDVVDNVDGTYTALFTGVEAGTATTIVATINSVNITTTMPTISVTFPTPNILNNAAFGAADWSGFTNNGGVNPPQAGSVSGSSVTLDAVNYDGGAGYSIKRVMPVTDSVQNDTAQIHYQVAADHDHWWSRFYFKFDAPMGTAAILKMQLVFPVGFNGQFSGFAIHSNRLAWYFVENFYTGDPSILQSSLSTGTGKITDGNWHSLEVHNYRNGNIGYDGVTDLPSAKIWLDNNLLTPADTGTNKLGADGYIYADSSYAGWAASGWYNSKRLYNPALKKLRIWSFAGVLNNNNTPQRIIWGDRVSISSLGRIGA